MKPQAWDAGHLGSSSPQGWPTSVHNSSVSESLGEKVRVSQVDLVYAPLFGGHGKPILHGADCTALRVIEVGSFSRAIQLKVTVICQLF